MSRVQRTARSLATVEAWRFVWRNRRSRESLLMAYSAGIAVSLTLLLTNTDLFPRLPSDVVEGLNRIYAPGEFVGLLYVYVPSALFTFMQGIYVVGTSRELVFLDAFLPGCRGMFVESRLRMLLVFSLPLALAICTSALVAGRYFVESVAFSAFHLLASPWLLLFASVTNVVHIDPNRSSFFNLEGHGVYQIGISLVMGSTGLIVWSVLVSVVPNGAAALILAGLSLLFVPFGKFLSSRFNQKLAQRSEVFLGGTWVESDSSQY